jgi:hypothetical protein
MLNKKCVKHGITIVVILFLGFLALGSGTTESATTSSSSRRSTTKIPETLSASQIIGMTLAQLRSAMSPLKVDASSGGDSYTVSDYPDGALMSLFDMKDGKVSAWTVILAYSDSTLKGFINMATEDWGTPDAAEDDVYLWLNTNNKMASNILYTRLAKEDIGNNTYVITLKSSTGED